MWEGAPHKSGVNEYGGMGILTIQYGGDGWMGNAHTLYPNGLHTPKSVESVRATKHAPFVAALTMSESLSLFFPFSLPLTNTSKSAFTTSKHVLFFERTESIYWIISASVLLLVALFLIIFFGRKHGWRSLFRYMGRVFAANPKDNIICVLEAMVPAFYTLGTIVLLKKMQSTYDTQIGSKLSVSALHQGDALAAAMGTTSWESIRQTVMVDNDLPLWGWVVVLVCGLLLKMYVSYDFAVRVPGNGARRTAILSIMETLFTNADSEFLRQNTPAVSTCALNHHGFWRPWQPWLYMANDNVTHSSIHMNQHRPLLLTHPFIYSPHLTLHHATHTHPHSRIFFSIQSNTFSSPFSTRHSSMCSLGQP